jgi:hypothetical protein
MQVHVDGKKVLDLNDTKIKVIKNDIHEDEFQSDMCRRVNWIVQHKYERCFQRLKQEWEPKLKAIGVKSIPLDDDEFAELVFSQPTYSSRKQRELDNKLTT